MKCISQGRQPMRLPIEWAVGGALVAVFWAVMGVAPARAVDPVLQIKYNPDPKAPFTNVGDEIAIRPNVEEPVFFAVKYPANDGKPSKVTVELAADGAVVATLPLSVEPGKTVAVSFAKPMPMPMAKPKPLEFKEAKGPPYSFEIRLFREPAKANEKRALLKTVTARRIMLPHEFLELVSSKYDRETGTLTVVVRARDTFFGPPCTVELVLPEERLPRLVTPKKREGLFQKTLVKRGDQAELFAKNVFFQLKDAPSLKGYVYVTVDGYARAFSILHDFADRTASGDPEVPPSIRLRGAPVAVNKKPYKFQVEVDYFQKTGMPDPDDVKVEIALLESDANVDYRRLLPPGARKQSLGYAEAGPEGAIMFKGTSVDWPIDDLPVKGIEGERTLRVRLLDKANKEIEWASTEGRKKLVAEMSLQLFAKLPDLVALVNAPRSAYPGTKVKLQAKAIKGFRASEVAVFLGKVPMDKLVPDFAELMKPSKAPGIWECELPVQDTEMKGKKSLTLMYTGWFSDGEEKKDSVSIPIEILSAPPVKPVGRIAVIVKLGPTKLTYPKAPLVLRRLEKGKRPEVVKEATADDEGKYLFDDVEPGDYVVSCQNPLDGQMRGSADVKVEVGKTAAAPPIVVKRPIK